MRGSSQLPLGEFFLRFSLFFRKKFVSLQRNINIEFMLGIDTPHVPVEGKFAEEIRATVHRVSTGNLNEADKRRIRRTRRVLKKFDAVWE